ncbi:hypothetical protein HX786_12105 [Pseudomonas sp. 21615526]|jgi:hypothetical protein|uniref:hypothetical protein n=1 Tax=Pseudomonas sp. 21615526 TaxID=2738811 RepID=UPI0015B8AC6F|nr:hypothetical protein [Pseudomonas sp. 21615526]NVZ38823.1 hypothetical protein [Pseudomonas sp. 21615526]
MQTNNTATRTRTLRAFQTFSIALMLAVIALTGCAPSNDSTALKAKTCARLGVIGPHLDTCVTLLPRVLNHRQKSSDNVEDTWANVKACTRLGITGRELSSCVERMPDILKEHLRNPY